MTVYSRQKSALISGLRHKLLVAGNTILLRSANAISKFNPANIPRMVGYTIMLFIAWLLIAALFRPWISTRATRAILDAPSILVTAPIDGIVTSINVKGGDVLAAGQDVAVITNATVSRESLISLQARQLELRREDQQISAQIDEDHKTLSAYDNEYRHYRQANIALMRSQIVALQAHRVSAHQQVEALNATYRRDDALVRLGAGSASAVDYSRARYLSARQDEQVATLKLREAIAAIADAHDEVYLSADGNTQLGQLSRLAQRSSDLRTGNDEARVRKAALDAQVREMDKLIASEADRVEHLSSYTMAVSASGTTQAVLSPVGTKVHAGDTVIRAVNCALSDVVAVFPAHVADRSTIGSTIKVKVAGVNRAVNAVVQQLLPKASDAMQNGFGVPFPYAEDGSVYAVAAWDRDLPPEARSRLCIPGRAVSVSLR